MKLSTIVFATILLAACNNAADSEKETRADSLPRATADTEYIAPVKDTSHAATGNWRDSLIVDYINTTRNPLVKVTREGGGKLEWMNDGLQKRDGVMYYRFQLGHSSENKFNTDAWLYIDTAKRKLYEYDLVEDKLISK
ncbi:hypothetical protein LZZ85_25690 [Terrimonas sp. NA20]|uniref:Lipoprotein n=1 Tax=Terrimonas ginsenosidimutans TaxID=2908004 RepID=A0ABS9KZG7_9BACT|nr:hypothetical protein [Terrimonas ginsenosidimutans]MCG2617720.1 hypothetical protein [Terrimonas ginsenosidimutans]